MPKRVTKFARDPVLLPLVVRASWAGIFVNRRVLCPVQGLKLLGPRVFERILSY